MLRYKTIIGPKLKARELPQQKTKAAVSVRVLNRMTGLGMPMSVKVAYSECHLDQIVAHSDLFNNADIQLFSACLDCPYKVFLMETASQKVDDGTPRQTFRPCPPYQLAPLQKVAQSAFS